MSIVNIQRDGMYVNLVDERVAASTAANRLTPLGNSTGAVNLDTGFVQYQWENALTIGEFEVMTFGALMKQPAGDRFPYRVKIYAGVTDNAERVENPQLALIIGYAPEAPTGIDDAIVNPTYYPINGSQLDDLFLVEESVGSGLEDRPLYFGIAVFGAGAGLNVYGHISVQNLGIKPPTMHNAIS